MTTPFYLRVKPSSGAVKMVISVSKKVSKKAVIRNLIRRRLRPLLARIVPKLKPAEYFVVAQTGADTTKGRELENVIKSLFAGRL